MPKWRIERPPDRWDLVHAVLQPPDVRSSVEFFVRRTRHDLVPAHIVLHALAHTEPGCLELHGTLVAVADHRVPPERVRCRIWHRTQTGEILSLGHE